MKKSGLRTESRVPSIPFSMLETFKLSSRCRPSGRIDGMRQHGDMEQVIMQEAKKSGKKDQGNGNDGLPGRRTRQHPHRLQAQQLD